MSEPNTTQEQDSHLQDEPRFERLQELRSQGVDPYAIERFDRTHSSADIVQNFEALEGQEVVIAGRLYQPRIMGKAAFADVRDESGRIQIYVKRDDVGVESYERFKHLLHSGDVLGVKGTVFRTRTGEISIHTTEYTVLALCLRTMPVGKEVDGERHGAMTDVEQRYRMRYVDLHANPGSREILVKRIKIVQAIRRHLEDKGFLDVGQRLGHSRLIITRWITISSCVFPWNCRSSGSLWVGLKRCMRLGASSGMRASLPVTTPNLLSWNCIRHILTLTV
jgi:lysyl-tRNA synthetase class 2